MDELRAGRYLVPQVQPAPHEQRSPHWQPGRRTTASFWQPHAQAGPEQEPQRQISVFDM
jgi:hypothetical protein